MMTVPLRDRRGQSEEPTEPGLRVMLLKDLWSQGKLEEVKKDFYLVPKEAHSHRFLDFSLLDFTMNRE